MKTRSDFVSNSSSSSFIVAIDKQYELKDFAKDLGKACTDSKSEYHDKNLAKRNALILEYCLSMFQAAFVGTWNIKDKFIDMFAVDNETMTYSFSRFHYDNDDANKTIKDRCKCLKRCALASDSEFNRKIDVFSITKDSISNTRQLIKSGEKICLENLDIDDLENRLDNGEKIFSIRVARDGDGYGSYHIFDETECRFIDSICMKILDSDCM